MSALTNLRALAATLPRSRPFVTPAMGRLAAGLAGIAAVVGAWLVFLAVVTTGSGWSGGYVSAAGVGDYAMTYRLGTISLAAALVLLGFSAATTLPVVAG